MPREFSRTQRVADSLKRELSGLIQFELRDPRIGMVSITEVEVSRDMGHAKVYYTSLTADNVEDAKESTEVLNKAAGFFRSKIARGSNMRVTPHLKFVYDTSVSRGRHLSDLIEKAAESDRNLGSSTDDTEQS
ncbi:MAG: ribosome-binding factor A [Halieaceae bacterium]|jgi:ribosome-binding factor A